MSGALLAPLPPPARVSPPSPLWVWGGFGSPPPRPRFPLPPPCGFGSPLVDDLCE